MKLNVKKATCFPYLLLEDLQPLETFTLVNPEDCKNGIKDLRVYLSIGKIFFRWYAFRKEDDDSLSIVRMSPKTRIYWVPIKSVEF